MKGPTPFLDTWRSDASRALTARGRKAELARYLSSLYGRPARSWESHIGQILAGTLQPSAETFLAIKKWLEKPTGKRAAVMST